MRAAKLEAQRKTRGDEVGNEVCLLQTEVAVATPRRRCHLQWLLQDRLQPLQSKQINSPVLHNYSVCIIIFLVNTTYWLSSPLEKASHHQSVLTVHKQNSLCSTWEIQFIMSNWTHILHSVYHWLIGKDLLKSNVVWAKQALHDGRSVCNLLENII